MSVERRGAPALRWLVVIALLLIAIIGPFLLFGDAIETWTRGFLSSHRTPGLATQVLCVALLASDVLLPVPSSLVSLACGMWWGPWLGAALSALGMTLGSCLAYGLGRWLGSESIRRWVGEREAARTQRLYERYGDWIVMLLRPVPVLAEASAVFAGVSKMNWSRFLLLSILSNALISLFYGSAGALLGRIGSGWELPILVVLLTLGAAAWSRVRRRA